MRSASRRCEWWRCRWSCRVSIRCLALAWRVLLRACASVPCRVPLATSTANGSPARRAPTLTLTSREAGARQQARQRLVGEAEPAIAELVAHPLFVVRAQVEDQQPPARAQDARRFGERRVPGRRRDAAPATAAPRRPMRSSSGSFSSSPRFQVMLSACRRPASALARASTAGDAIDRGDVARPARGFDGEVALAAADVGDVERRQQMPERARPGRPAAARHQLPAVARVGPGVRRSSRAAAAALPAAATRRP